MPDDPAPPRRRGPYPYVLAEALEYLAGTTHKATTSRIATDIECGREPLRRALAAAPHLFRSWPVRRHRMWCLTNEGRRAALAVSRGEDLRPYLTNP